MELHRNRDLAVSTPRSPPGYAFAIMNLARPTGLKSLTLFLIVFLFLLASPLAAQPPLTLHQIVELRTVKEVAISPDGGRVAYVLEVPRRPLAGEEDGPAWNELHLAVPGGESRPWIAGKVNVSKIYFAPGGQSLAFLAKHDGDTTISLYAIPLAGGEARQLLTHTTDVTDFSLSPDGRRVAFVAPADVPRKRRDLIDKGFTQEVFEEDQAPAELRIADLEGVSTLRRLPVEGSVREVAWSPRGDLLAVKVSPTPSVDDGLMATRVRLLDIETGAVLGRIENPGKLGKLAWSPDGQQLAMISAADPADPNAGRLMLTAAVGGELRDLLPGLLGDVVDFAWQGVGRVWALVQEGTGSRLVEIEVASGAETTLVPRGEQVLERLSAASEAAALIASTPRHPDELYYLAAGSRQPARLTDGNPGLVDARFAFQEVVRYPARDGLDLEGVLIHPLERPPGARVPLVVIVHGGPEAHFSNGWLTTHSRPGQLLAARGMAVFYPNYRGSTGRGVAFSKLGQGDPAGKEFDDLVDGVDHLIDVGLVDRAKVGITGGSYGGYATAWAATKLSDRFAAAVMFAGATEEVSKWGTSDIPNELVVVHSLRWPWQDWAFALERSPVRWVEQARTPLLILHGKDDPRVHPGQALLLYRALKTLGKVPVRLVLYPGEKHGNRRAASRLDYGLRLVEWLGHYLTGPGGAPPPAEIEVAP